MVKTIPYLLVAVYSFVTVAALHSGKPARAQVVVESAVPDAATRARVEEARARARAAAESRGEAPPAGGPPGQAKPDEKPDEKKPDEKKDAEEKPTGPAPVTRPSEPNTPADPNELKVKLDGEGKINLALRGQKWVDVLQMLADLSELAFDWTELPGDVVNLTTPGKITLDEARDKFNRMLLDRGYTMLRQKGTLSVHNIKKLNPALVPRVAPEDLEQRDPHELVKVSFKLSEWLQAETAAKDLSHMKSPNGTLNPLPAANRLEAIDAAVNLIQIREVLADELSFSGQKRRIRVFQIVHRNAADVDEMLKGLLGIESKPTGPPAPMSREQMEMQRQMQQQMARMQQQQQQQGGGVPEKPKDDVRLVVNQRENTILAFAPPEKMAIIEQAIEAIDIPASQAQSLPDRLLRMKIYKLATMDPEPLISILDEIGGLNYNTVLKLDKKSNAIVAYATLADHVTIDALVKKLDGSARRFQVIPLRRLRADYVAGTIEFMMGAGEENQNDRRRYYFYRREEEEDKTDKFRVDADVENNWLLVRANESEMREIDDLLVQLGEKRVPGSNQNTVRYLDAAPGEEMEAVLERIRRIWPRMAPNKLDIEPAPENDEDQPDESSGPRVRRRSDTPSNTTTTESSPDVVPTVDRQPASSIVRLAQLRADESITQDAASEDDRASSQEASPQLDDLLNERLREAGIPLRGQRPLASDPESPPPIKISRGPDGRLILSSDDTDALDLLEDLLAQHAPRRRDYEIFKLTHADAFYVQLNLEDYFKDKEEDSSSRFPFFFFYDYGRSSDDNKRRRLSDRKPIKFIYDSATNSIVVQNADPGQLRIVKELIEFYDQPDPPDSQTVRRMEFFQLKYANANTVVERIKEVFIDLLTPNDKARQKPNEQQAERVVNYNYGDAGDGELKKLPKFKGQLHVTADTASNTVVVLAPGYVMDPVRVMIDHLDEAAKPSTTVQVLKVGGSVSAEVMQNTLEKLVGGKKGPAAPEGPKAEGKEGEGGPPQQGGPRTARGQSVAVERGG